ncbi:MULTISPECIES: 3-oxoacyl-[acyl-carrier-protein] synthase III C-terminal domain-containing protein [Pseudomonas]|uniref:3-oxoacyl-ACP synthase n=1 Tax=Pseudomonas protegens TaxID=380021 RepID=A0A2T6GRC3_9PSED|nr:MULTISPECIES: 3-oxoacyl-[acyl-carrier-protein] synthase III C-terminal domain-containing protein [Pseudomonas]PUA46690.1 3-oxoacyl-ACP synthase [Pseudomonas protegens]RXU67712.1 3-oxoacyl-ACP synthase [Pseudomonas protegens]
MKIVGLSGILPSRIVTNQDVLDLVEEHSKNTFQDDLPKTLKTIGKLLDKSGIETRHWLAAGEKPMDLMTAAFDSALAQANINKADLDLLIYPNVTRGFIEPANSTFMAKALGLNCRNFDVVDACNGWVTAMDVINSKMEAGEIRYAAIINMEFGMSDGGPVMPKNFSLQSPSELAYKFPSFTIGEAATVTILSNESPGNFKFSYINRPDLSDLSTISLPDWKLFCNEEDTPRIAPTGGQYQFNSYAAALHEDGRNEAIKVFNMHKVSGADIHKVFIHTGSPKMWEHIGELIGIDHKLHHVGHKTGNIITASIPYGIYDAISRGNAEKDQFCMGWAGSGGMVFSALSFRL